MFLLARDMQPDEGNQPALSRRELAGRYPRIFRAILLSGQLGRDPLTPRNLRVSLEVLERLASSSTVEARQRTRLWRFSGEKQRITHDPLYLRGLYYWILAYSRGEMP